MNEFYIKPYNGKEMRLSDITQHIELLSLDENPAITNTYQSNPAQDGELWNYSTYNPTVVNCEFLLYFSTWQDYILAKHDIMRTFMQKGLFRIREEINSQLVRYVRTSSFTISPDDKGSNWVTFTIPFDNPSGMKYSLYRSDEVDSNGLKVWSYGQNLTDNDCSYRFSDKSFRVYNPSDIAIDPYLGKHDLKIISKFSGSSLKITNTTNGTSWSYNKSSNGSETILLDGIVTTVNGNPATVNTDYGHIVLNTGWNDIVVSGTNSSDITFSFPFIYI